MFRRPHIGGGKVDSLKLATAKLQPDAASAALRLMDCFSPEEMMNSNPSGVSKRKDATRIATTCVFVIWTQ